MISRVHQFPQRTANHTIVTKYGYQIDILIVSRKT